VTGDPRGAQGELELPVAGARAILAQAGLRPGNVRVSAVRRRNHVWRIDTDSGAYFVKAWTKDWYDWADTLTTGALNADHEAGAFELLAAHGLAVPEVVAVDETAGNPLGRPLLLTRGLAGSPFPDALAQTADAAERHALVRAVGAYQARMHAIVLAAPGYFGRRGPFPGDWEHSNQSARAYYRVLEGLWRADEEAGVPPDLVAQARGYAERMRPRVEAAFVPPCFTQANCHAAQFFVARTPGGWAVTGVVDMEVALGGWPLCDMPGIVADLSHPRFGGYRWWRPWVEGYGEPGFDLVRFVLLTTGQSWWAAVAPQGWGAARRDRVMRHLLASGAWDELLDVSALRRGEARRR
jgi:Ser/Thr protein kinase RdoA (MazF antagonist)